MKVLFDPIYSAQPHKCSSAAKYKKIAQRLLSERPDTFIYWLVPDWADEDAQKWLLSDLEHSRIKYIVMKSTKDRVREYQIYGHDRERYVSFFGECWDYDVMITMRTAMVPTMKVSMFSPRQVSTNWMKKIITLEEMAIFDFRKTVPVSVHGLQDAMTALGYLASDVTYITANHVRDGIINAAKKIYTPSNVQKLRDSIRLVSPVIIDEYSIKAPEHRFKRGKEPFCLGFVGRMSNSMTRLPDVYDVMDKNWIMKGDKGFKVIISTISTCVKLPPPDFVVFENNPREKFWARVKEDMHLVISLSIDAEFSMGLIEPVLFGTPLVIAREDWTEGLLGKDYPFFVKGKTEAYAMVRAFHDDYEAMYAQFLEWRETKFKPRFEPGGIYQTNLYDDLWNEIGHFDDTVDDIIRTKHPKKGEGNVSKMIMDYVADRDEFRFADVMKEMGEKKLFKHFDWKAEEQDVGINITFMTPHHESKVVFRAFYGWTDASTEVGHFRRYK